MIPRILAKDPNCFTTAEEKNAVILNPILFFTKHQRASHQKSEHEEEPKKSLENAVITGHIIRELLRSLINFLRFKQNIRITTANRQCESLTAVVRPGKVLILCENIQYFSKIPIKLKKIYIYIVRHASKVLGLCLNERSFTFKRVLGVFQRIAIKL